MMTGIDLGTTNSALAYIDAEEAAGSDFPPIRLLEIPQYVAEGIVEARRSLPSFLFLGEERYAGVHAREQGALVPARVVSSAKSWLSNPEVDRTAQILPWDARASERSVSPVAASAEFLAHMKRAWEQSGREPLDEHPVVLTVPASFDEEGRELTVAAAEQAGLKNIVLLEEPSAAFYTWVAQHPAEAREKLSDGQTVLVCDVGGGTTDFTLIRISREDDRLEFTRTAVGRHLLLGGDNLDLTLAWLVEMKLGKGLSLRQRAALRRQCAAAKEQLLSDANAQRKEITVLGSGSALIGGTLQAQITREEAIELTYTGFLPVCQLSDRPKEDKKSLFRELGLPYVSDPAITRHLAAFLSEAADDISQGPDAILFNGGFFNPVLCRERLADVVESWYGRRPLVLESRDLDLAVAMGAAYYSYVRATGAGLLVRGGIPRTYYLGAAGAEEGEKIQAVCLVPRGTENGLVLELERDDLQLVANRPVSFRLYSSLTRLGDREGELVEFTVEQLEGEIHRHAPLHAVMRFGKARGDRLVPVKLVTRLTEVGTLDIWCESKVSDHRWKLQFELRRQPEKTEQAPRAPATVVSEAALEEAAALLGEAFDPGRDALLAPEDLPARLEQAMGLGRQSWPLEAIRKLGDAMLKHATGRSRNAPWEARWLNLCGFCLRPGFGDPADKWRIEQTRPIYTAGVQFASHAQNAIEWWIFWGRIAGGLNRNQQVDMFHRLSGVLLPRGGKRRRINKSLLREMWRASASLELLPVQTKISLGEALMARLRAGDYSESELWCLSRLGARELFYGPANQVLPPATVTAWVRDLLPIDQAAEALTLLARQTGDTSRDLPAHSLAQVRRKLEESRRAERLLAVFEGDEKPDAQSLSRIFGEELPAGLVIGAGAES